MNDFPPLAHAPGAREGTGRTSFVLDTDIGSDVDDLLALAMTLGSPELDLTAVTTVYGDVELRARITARAFAAAERRAPSIAPGLRTPRSGREVWWPGHEGETIEDLDRQTYRTRREAVAELGDASTLAAIGPLTNVGAAVETPGRSVERIVMMGGCFDGERVEHNVRCDTAAAHAVLSSGIDLTVVGLEQTERISLDEADLARIGRNTTLGRLLDGEVRRFWRFVGRSRNTPHDALAVLVMARPDLFELRRGHVSLTGDGEQPGLTTFVADDGGPHQIVTDYDLTAAHDEIVARIATACHGGRPDLRVAER
ncbi:nucleoside hydrolase [Georgenia alba]|uniref:Nucleoside hydrolase n=1 Tax=Georgenia alba TaxID=2233858 RepID=A0ABW2Q8L0_9MICO